MEGILSKEPTPFDASGGLQLAGSDILSGYLDNNPVLESLPTPSAMSSYGFDELLNLSTQGANTLSSGFDNHAFAHQHVGVFSNSVFDSNLDAEEFDLTSDSGHLTAGETFDSLRSSGSLVHEDEYLVGDWNGDGRDNIAVRRGNQIWMDFNFDGTADFIQAYGNGNSEDEYLVGDWDGDGRDNIAVRRGNQIWMDSNFDGTADFIQAYGNGNTEDEYLVGDWNGDNRDNIAVRRGNQIWMDFNFNGFHDFIQAYGDGNTEDEYLVGDWNGDNRDNIAVRRGNQIWMDFNFNGFHDFIQSYGVGNSEDEYLVGDWNGDNRDNIAVRRGNQIWMDFNFNGFHDLIQSYGNGTTEIQQSANFSSIEQVSLSNSSDFYHFRINQSGIFTANLTGLTGDADVRLIQDRNHNGQIDQGEVLAWQWERGTGSESIRRFLNSGDYFVQVMSYNNQTANYNLSTNFTTAVTDNRNFDIQLNFSNALSGLNTNARNAIQQAAQFWEQVISHSTFNGVHNLSIDVTGASLSGNTLAQAGPRRYQRDANNRDMPVTGAATINTNRLSTFNSNPDFLRDIMIHEFGHVFGIGTLWESRGRDFVRRSDGTYNANTYAGWAYGELNNTFRQTAIPLTTNVGSGSDYGHWREQVFTNEIMTHAIGSGGSPMSQMTIASLRDIGWNVNYGAAQPYSLTQNVVRVTVNRVQAIDNPDSPFGSADFYARVNIGGVDQRSDDISDRNDIRPNWQFSHGTSSSSVPITLRIDDADSGLRGGDDHVDINPFRSQKDLQLNYNLSTGVISGPGVIGTEGNLITIRGAGDSNRALIQFTVDQLPV
ncbi:MAG: hypothetical protein F6J86_31180 [Symploca sp. SIO1B1]|nr:hypothetical protein [Symploca sp. SIO1C2]NER98240.1 hypothetical protein [Symploca sp. SIO1B1]